MALNYDLWSPRLRPLAAQDLDVDLDSNKRGGSLRGIDLYADGTLHYQDVDGNIDTLTFAGISVSHRYILQIQKIFSDSTIAVTNMRGLR